MPTVVCGECGHKAVIGSPSDAWKCNCAAGISPDSGCGCDAVNAADGTEDNPPEVSSAEIAELEARLLELRGGIAPTGDVS